VCMCVCICDCEIAIARFLLMQLTERDRCSGILHPHWGSFDTASHHLDPRYICWELYLL